MAQQRVEGNFSQGWGIAALVVLLVIGCFATAFYINRHTYRSFNDPTVPGSTPVAEHR